MLTQFYGTIFNPEITVRSPGGESIVSALTPGLSASLTL